MYKLNFVWVKKKEKKKSVTIVYRRRALLYPKWNYERLLRTEAKLSHKPMSLIGHVFDHTALLYDQRNLLMQIGWPPRPN